MKTLLCTLLLLPLLVTGCGDDDDDGHEHTFDSYFECWEHETEEGAGPTAILASCDEELSVTHDDEADCLADHEADVTDGVAQADVDAHCAAL